MKYKIVFFLLVFLLVSCGISEDCFKGNGNQVTQTFLLENFSKIKVYDGVGLVVKEGSNYEVKVVTSDNIIDDLEVRLDGDMLVVKDNSSCNIARDYGQTTVYVTIPDGTISPLIPELELHCKTEQKIQSDGVLHSPIVRLFSIGDDGDGAGIRFILILGTGEAIAAFHAQIQAQLLQLAVLATHTAEALLFVVAQNQLQIDAARLAHGRGVGFDHHVGRHRQYAGRLQRTAAAVHHAQAAVGGFVDIL